MRPLARGARVLCDFDPAMGQVDSFRKNESKGVVVRLFPNKLSVRRDARCLLVAGNKGEATDNKTFDRGDTLRCKSYRIPLHPNEFHTRSGSVVMQKWFKTKRTPGGGIHLTEPEYILYAIVLDGHLVFKPHDDPEMTTYYPDTAGPADGTALCVLENSSD